MPRRYALPVKRSPKSDPQRNLVYRMESEAIGGRSYLTLTKARIISLMKTLSRTYHVPAVTLRFSDMKGWAADWQPPNIITFGKKTTSRDFLTALHEFAHHLHYVIAPSDDHQGHGPEFMCCYMSVLDTVRLLPIEAMAVVCDQYKVKYIKPAETDGIDGLAKRIK